MNKVFAVSASPHLHEGISVRSVMWQVVIALIPAMVAAVILFGINALLLTLYGIIAAVLTEAGIQKIRKMKITISDGSAVVTGMLVSFNIHSASPWWLPVIGAVFAIAIGKHVFGGLGHNIFNPALLGRAFMVASWPTLTTAGWVKTSFGSINGMVPEKLAPEVLNHAGFNSLTGATPLGVVKMIRNAEMYPREIAQNIMEHLSNWDVISDAWLGNIGGVIGEVSAPALIVGALFLAARRIIDWRIPVSFILTVYVFSWMFGGLDGLFSAPPLFPLFSILTGGVMLGALFMATDMVTSPITKRGRLIFGIGCGFLTVAIRTWGGYPEGVSYSILLMNIAVPLIDRYTMPKPFGEGK